MPCIVTYMDERGVAHTVLTEDLGAVLLDLNERKQDHPNGFAVLCIKNISEEIADDLSNNDFPVYEDQ